MQRDTITRDDGPIAQMPPEMAALPHSGDIAIRLRLESADPERRHPAATCEEPHDKPAKLIEI
jgi:hypothetical protein